MARSARKLGRPVHFRQKYADRRWIPRGNYSRTLAGTSVVRGCDETMNDAFADSNGEVPEHAWISLVLAVKVGKETARVRRTLIDYTVGDTPYTLRVSWAVGGKGYLHHH